MKIGIIGEPNSGKTTIFNALTGSATETGAYSSGRVELHTAVVNVPDPRLGRLAAMFYPRKAVYAQVIYNDIAGLAKGSGRSGGISGSLLNTIAANDALLVIGRGFDDAAVPYAGERIDPAADLEAWETEFLLHDMATIEGRLARIAAQHVRGTVDERQRMAQEEALLKRLGVLLEEGTPLRAALLHEDERKRLGGFGFLSLKPRLRVVNAEDDDDESRFAHLLDDETFFLRGRLEAEIAAMDPQEAAEFLAEFEIPEPGLKRAIRRCYELLGLLNFFTIGENEVRAWSIAHGAKAPEAAGIIHSDMQAGFIRAETVHYDDLMAAGSMADARRQGKLRLEGKEYVVQDGDILTIRFHNPGGH